MKLRIWQSQQMATWQPNVWDMVALLILFSLFILLAWAAKQMNAPYHIGEILPITTSLKALPYYTLRTVLRIVIAMGFSLLFTFTIGTLAAKNKHAQRVIIPIIDVLQSVPVLGFLSITIVGFISLFPNSLLGPECAAIFAIFTCQAWNMFLGFYQSLRTIPHEISETVEIFQLSAWQKFWRIEVPFAIPSLIWNMMISLSTSWFFVVASEAIAVNNQKILLPGIGSYIRMAILHKNTTAVIYAIVVMLGVILIYDQLLFRPLVQWSEKFKSDQEEESLSKSFILKFFLRTHLIQKLGDFFAILLDLFINLPWLQKKPAKFSHTESPIKTTTIFGRLAVYFWYVGVIATILFSFGYLVVFIHKTMSIKEILHVVTLGGYTSIRIISLVLVCSLIWVPLGVWIGLRPRVAKIVQPIAQILSAFPANVLFPIVVIWILRYHLNFEIWSAPLMMLGPQWYILFNIVAGTTTIPKNLKYAAQNFGVSGWVWWKRIILPVVFPYFITGAITAAGGAWNATIVAEIVTWGHTTLKATGLGAYITQVTTSGDFAKVALGIAIMCLYVLFFDHIIWQPLYNWAVKKLK